MDSAITNIEQFIKSLRTRNISSETRATLDYLRRYDQLKTNIDKYLNSLAHKTSNAQQIINTISKIERAILSQATTITQDFHETAFPTKTYAQASQNPLASLVESQRETILAQTIELQTLRARVHSLERQNNDLHLVVDRLNKLFQ